MSTQITRRDTIFGASTLAATSLVAGELSSQAQAVELNPQPLSPSPGWSGPCRLAGYRALKMTKAYAKLVARDAYFWRGR